MIISMIIKVGGHIGHDVVRIMIGDILKYEAPK